MLCLCYISNNQSNPIKAKDHLQALERHIKMWGFLKDCYMKVCLFDKDLDLRKKIRELLKFN